MKVLVVDDEAMICEWLQFCISQNPSCVLTGVAHNGREALELFEKEEPDLILTDIKMPVMDGLELLHTLRLKNSRVRVVMLTAFSDFDLVRQALRDGAAEYLLKPEMQNDVLQELLNRIEGEMKDSAGKDGQDIASLSREHSVISRLLRQGRELGSEELEKLRQCNVRWRNSGLFALAVWKQKILNSGLIFPQENWVRHVTVFDYTDRIHMIIGNFPRTVSEAEKARQLMAYARQVQQMNDCMVGVSSITDEMSRIPFMALQAACSLEEGFYCGEKRLYEPRYPVGELLCRKQEWKNTCGEFRVRLHQNQGVGRNELIREFLDYAKSQRILATDLVCRLCVDAFDLLELEAGEKDGGLADGDALRTALGQCISFQEAEAVMMSAARRCSVTADQQTPRSKNISLAVEYIQSHYSEQISLEQVADQVYLNPEYFSRAFKAEVGQTFVNYLTDVRLKHSVRLLENTALRVQDIAQQVGYYNASYFSTIFKKKYGMSPYEYRRRGS